MRNCRTPETEVWRTRRLNGSLSLQLDTSNDSGCFCIRMHVSLPVCEWLNNFSICTRTTD